MDNNSWGEKSARTKRQNLINSEESPVGGEREREREREREETTRTEAEPAAAAAAAAAAAGGETLLLLLLYALIRCVSCVW